MDWRSQFNNPIVTKKDMGDRETVELYRGEARKLLYELKNLMRFQGLGQLKMTRFFIDGTVITAWSIFGHDFVNIDVSMKTVQDIITPPECTITLFNLPDTVQPMHYPGEIKNNEIEGTDYIKTYYQLDIGKCPKCQEMAFSLTFTFKDAGFPGKSNEPDNHCLYSISPPCWGEVIDQAYDKDGTYFRWKAYTESNEYSRTGSGYIKLKISVDSGSEPPICTFERVIQVDCCRKEIVNRQTLMYWQKCDFLNDWCPVPDEPQSYHVLSFFWQYLNGHRYINLKAYPERSGSCPTYKWQNKGSGSLEVSEDTLDAILYLPFDNECTDRIIVLLQDRCGTEDKLEINSCCDENSSSLVINYTSLQMSCNDSQDLSVSGGCGPYTWSLSGGGSITPNFDGSIACYQAPSSNPNCQYNPTITVRDCCGNISQIKIAVNCYTPLDQAFAEMKCRWLDADYCQNIDCGTCGVISGCRTHPQYIGYGCDGSVVQSQIDGSPCGDAGPSLVEKVCSYPTSCGNCCDYMGIISGSQCWSGTGCPTVIRTVKCGDNCDVRTQTMKDQGCCPLNPWTGLPY